MNPLAEPNSSPDVVLLFECDGGWNRSGGAELLTTSHHEGKGCGVLFADGHVAFVAAEVIPLLRWEGKVDGKKQEVNQAIRNARRPKTRKELEYWLQNMVWYHHFTTDEVCAATGLDPKTILAVQKESGIMLGNRPARIKEAPLLVLPYPGGRHPRIGFLEGAIDPQRETKFSVFTPWDPNSYVVVDVPEAIWSNLGLTYLAHTHIDTIWTKQGIELPKLEWSRRPDGGLVISRTLPNGIMFAVKAVPSKEAVRMEMWLRNGTDQQLTDLRVQMCVMTKMAAGFAEQTNKNKVFTNPYVACRSSDGKRWIVTAWEGCNRPWGNEQCPCFHSDPKFPDLGPGQRHRLRGWLSFYEGDDIQAEFARIEATGWRRD
jgi:prepilin-type processing-associated H-X9-DG protein